jgi:hypothetical protein
MGKGRKKAPLEGGAKTHREATLKPSVWFAAMCNEVKAAGAQVAC